MIHFIYPVTDKTRPWSVVNTLAVKLARKHNPDAEIVVWTNKSERVPDIHAKNIRVRQTTLPDEIRGVKIIYPQYVADVFRLQLLSIYGGVYMDTDMLSLQPVHQLVEDRLILSWETAEEKSICNALMLANPGNAFVDEWLANMPRALSSPIWAYGGVVLPMLMVSGPTLWEHRTIMPHTFACPLDLSKNWMFDPALKEEAKQKISSDTHAIHVFETYWRDQLNTGNGCLFDELEEHV
jgi:hypothetical protein